MKKILSLLFFFFWNFTCFSSQVETLKPVIVAKIPHAPGAFTQGLSIEKQYLYESSGLYGRSQLTCTDLNSGKVIKKQALPSKYFAEGIAILSDRVIQITWREQTAFVYDRSNLNLLYTIPYKGEGWGLCYADNALWQSDGTSILKRCNPKTLSVEELLPVKLDGRPVHFLNDLTIADAHIYANVWPKDMIVRIDRTTGTVDGVIEAADLLSPEERAMLGREDVLNGIAYHPEHNTFFVTGKRWPWIFEVAFPSRSELSITLSYEDAQQLGRKIWQNESRGSLEGLTCWNQGEEFASLGIGHCIWYPAGQTGHFKEKFPELLAFFKAHHVVLPSWLEEAKGAPWKSREEFYRDFHDEKMVQLREILAKHVDLQILFMIDWLNKALPRMLSNLEDEHQRRISIQFHRLANIPAGIYALLDYLNFKGEGVAPNESYQGHRWGLLQVLDRMDRMSSNSSAVEQFVEAAKKVLYERVQHAPKERNEQRWLQGWFNRLDTYFTERDPIS